ncbi:MAG: DUF2442 domain-containing protein [Vulcanimicrobiaceae bacterium]
MGSKAVVLSDKEIKSARERGREIANSPSAVTEVYAMPDRTLSFRFKNGARLEIPLTAIDELSEATESELREIVISPLRDSISLPQLDVDIYVPGLISDVLNSNAASNFARLGGSKKTALKRAASRANGGKGGRPKKTAASAGGNR